MAVIGKILIKDPLPTPGYSLALQAVVLKQSDRAIDDSAKGTSTEQCEKSHGSIFIIDSQA